jgi:hypothetical protein
MSRVGSPRRSRRGRVGCFLVLASAGAFAQAPPKPSFSVDFDAPTRIEGRPGAGVGFSAATRLFTEGLEAGDRGAQGWVMSVSAEGCRIVEATTQGTVAATVAQGGVRDNGFELTELTMGPGNEGAISLVILSINMPVSLDPGDSPHTLLRLSVEGAVPLPAICSPCTLLFMDGLHGSGLPQTNEVTHRGKAYLPAKTPHTTQACLEACPPGAECGAQHPGDCNQDNRVDISDAICLLGALFLGRPSEFPCGDGTREHAGNLTLLSGNGDARIDISDAVYLLNFLFLGGPPHVQGTECLPIVGCEAVCR